MSGRALTGGRAETYPLAADEIHVYVAELDVQPDVASVLAASLSAEECSRAARFRFDLHRDRYVARRGLLRVLLGRYLGEKPRDISLTAGAYGKPELGPAIRPLALAFNLSHSAGIAVYACARDRRIGIDVEEVRSNLDHRALAARFFAPAERAQLELVDEPELPNWFFACWTRKEAVVKAHGAGLSLPLDSFEVSVNPRDVSRLVKQPPGNPADKWHLSALQPRPGFIGALAFEGAPATIVTEEFTLG